MKTIGIREHASRGTKNYPFELLHFDITNEAVCVMYHWHPEIEILFLHEGSFLVNIEGREYNAKAGDIFFVSPEMLHSITSGCEGHIVYDAILCFPSLFSFSEKNDIQEKITDPLTERKIAFFDCVQKEDGVWKELSEIIKRIISLNSSPDRHSRMETTYLFLSLLVLLYKNHLFKIPESENYDIGRIRTAISYIEKNYNRTITLAELASLCKLSERYFCTFFKTHTGKTPICYINDVRINSAAEKLRTSSDSVTSIALESGFENIGYFTRLFFRKMKMSPTEYRKKNKSVTAN